MTQVNARPGENIESLLKRFKKAVEYAGILGDYKKHESYEKPGVRKRKKREAARKRAAKHTKREKVSKVNFKFSEDRTEKIFMKPNAGRKNFRSRYRKSNDRTNR